MTEKKKMGRPKGSKSPESKLRDEAMKQFRMTASRMSKKLLMAQSIEAFGAYSILRKDEITNPKTKKTTVKWNTVTDNSEIADVLNGLGDVDERGVVGDKYYIIVKDKPSHKAADAILNRAWGRPKETVEMQGEGGGPILINFDK